MILSIKEIEETISRNNFISELLECQRRLLSSVTTHDEQLATLSYKRVKAPSINRDISELLLQVDRNEQNSIQELMSAVKQVNLEIDQCNRIKICFEITRIIFPKGYYVCFDLLQMKYTWDVVNVRNKICRASINTLKNRELRLVLILYCMYDDTELIIDRWRERYKEAQKNGKTDLAQIIKEPELVLTQDELKKAHFGVYV